MLYLIVPSASSSLVQFSRAECPAFTHAISKLDHAQEKLKSDKHASKVAVCLTGQLRLFMVGFPTLVENLLMRAAATRLLHFFYIGPADLSFSHGRTYLQQVPGLRNWTLYSPKLMWRKKEVGVTGLAELRRNSGRAEAHFNFGGVSQRCTRVPLGRLKSTLVQALQARECLRLIRQAEVADGQTYAAVLRLRADMLPLQPIHFPAAMPSHHVFTSFARCESGRTERTPIAPHDFALFGERRVMDVLLGTLTDLPPTALERSGCDVSAAAAARLRRLMPEARCVVGRRNGTSALASVRGSIVSNESSRRKHHGCYFLDQEHPPNDGQAQPRLAGLFPGADDVATHCLSLREERDGRRPGAGPVCAPRGGWDGDFREDDSPWAGKRSPANLFL